MAITSDVAIEKILKTYYKDGVENLLFRNSPVLKKINKTKVEGKEQAFAALYSRGGAVASDFLEAKKKAAENVKNAEFRVTPGQLFSVFSYNAKEVEASLSKRGAYMKIAGNKAFAANEALRKTLAAALYGKGYGELAVIREPATTAFTTAAVQIELPEDAVMKIDVGSVIVLKTSLAGSPVMTAEVTSIDDDTTVTITPAAGYTVVGGEVWCLAGSTDSSGNPMMPMGLEGWLPIRNARSGSTWTSYLSTPFFGVTRSVAPARLAGQFVAAATDTEKKTDTLMKLIKKIRRAGGNPDFIIVNDNDWYDISKELETTNTFFTSTVGKGKKHATKGFTDAAFAFSTNWVDSIYDDPYCPEKKFYVLDSSAVEYFVYTNTSEIADGVAENEPGKPNVLSDEDKGRENDSYKLLIDDLITVDGGQDTSDGPAVRVTLNFFGSLVVLNTSNVGVGLFASPKASPDGTNDFSGIIGYAM